METNTVKQSLKEELLKILSINQSADSFVNGRSPYQLTRKAKINWTGIAVHVVLHTLKLMQESRLKTLYLCDS